MKNAQRNLLFVTFFLIALFLPFIGFSKNKDSQPSQIESAAPTPIDLYVVYIAVLAVGVAFYYLVLKKKNNSWSSAMEKN